MNSRSSNRPAHVDDAPAHRSWAYRVSPSFEAENPLADPSCTELTINLLRVGEQFRRKMDELLRAHGLTLASLNVLQILCGADEPLSPGRVSDQLLTTAPALSQVLVTMEHAGLVERRANPADGRSSLLRPTRRGRALDRRVADEIFAAEKQWTRALTPEQRRRLVDLLGTLRSGFVDHSTL